MKSEPCLLHGNRTKDCPAPALPRRLGMRGPFA